MNSLDAVHLGKRKRARVLYTHRRLSKSRIYPSGPVTIVSPDPLLFHLTVIRCPGTTRCPQAMGVSLSHFSCTPAAVEMDGGLHSRTSFVFNSCPLLFLLPCPLWGCSS
ncbi:uncharacterized protein NPIL_319371 [Nephila pilipes]|uniref:Uncharacterized protein n=1 Tax=Nephila pilipes TaxID=299642 RepID=A0A8X6N1Z0_NEPPI|nr:uncharacterized protein NPIL_319371 [Nephila pilipes]